MQQSLKIACFFLLLPLGGALASSCDSLIFETDNLKMFFCEKKQDYRWLDKKTNETVKHLKFVERLGREFQVLDGENQLFYIDENGKRSEESIYRRFICGTVPHFIMSVVETDSTFEVYEDETRYDSGNKIPAALQTTISKKDADSVCLMNGKMEFGFTSNFGYMSFSRIDPRTLILVKDGQFFTQEHPELKYDVIAFSPQKELILTRKGTFYGILDVVEPKYTEISKFEFYLAKVTLPNGEVKYIDTEGREY